LRGGCGEGEASCALAIGEPFPIPLDARPEVNLTPLTTLTMWAMSMFYTHAPLWAWLAGMALMVPAAWVGALLRVRHSAGAGRARRT
jgi:hypothetical protein